MLKHIQHSRNDRHHYCITQHNVSDSMSSCLGHTMQSLAHGVYPAGHPGFSCTRDYQMTRLHSTACWLSTQLSSQATAGESAFSENSQPLIAFGCLDSLKVHETLL